MLEVRILSPENMLYVIRAISEAIRCQKPAPQAESSVVSTVCGSTLKCFGDWCHKTLKMDARRSRSQSGASLRTPPGIKLWSEFFVNRGRWDVRADAVFLAEIADTQRHACTLRDTALWYGDARRTELQH